jgi:hypothetical protein
VFLKQLRRARSERIVAVSDYVTFVRGFDGVDDFRMDTGVVVAGETSLDHTLPAFTSRAISRAAFAPGKPVMPPPGWVPAPQR